MVTVPNQALIDQGNPTIMLAGQEWPVPVLAPKQNRVVVPALDRIMKKWAEGQIFESGVYNDYLTVVYMSLTRAHPNFLMTEFEEMPITTDEVTIAVKKIAFEISGIYKQGDAETEKKTT